MAPHAADPDGGGGFVTSEGGGGLSDDEREFLRRVALDSILCGLEKGRALEPELEAVPPCLRVPGAAFVTLNLRGQLRGCVGSFEARRPLLQDVARNAYSAAFRDFRFPPLSTEEFPELELHISLLTPLEPLGVESREDLLRKLRPGVDGLLLEEPPHRATFLPQVWESLRDPKDFLEELFLKAGLRRDHWSDALRFHRYSVEEF
ncbi:MAG: AmmeMemoRadiSam system protein A [Gemmatimonadota bacterium]